MMCAVCLQVEGMMEFSGETPIRAALSVISLNGLVSFDDVDTEQAHPNNDNNKAKDSLQGTNFISRYLHKNST